MAAKNDRVDIFIGVDTSQKDLPFYTTGRDEVIHAVQRAQEGRFPAAGRSDERGDLVLFNAKIDALQCLKRAVVKIDILAVKADIVIDRDGQCLGRSRDRHGISIIVHYACSPSVFLVM